MSSPAARVSLTILGLIAVVCGWAVMPLSLSVTPGLAEESATPGVAASSVADPLIDDYRLRFGKIFLGTVVAVTGKDAVATSEPMDSLPVILYAVDISQSIPPSGFPGARPPAISRSPSMISGILQLM